MRLLATVLALIALLGLLGGLKGAQIATLVSSGKEAAQAGPPPEYIGSAVAREETWETTLSDVGSVASRRGVTISNEVPGIVTRVRFDSGQLVKKGDVLVELDTDVERAQLGAAIARKQLANTTEERTSTLVQSGALAEAQLDSDRAELESATNDVAALRAQIDRKTINAPFDGRLGIRGVNVGQYLNAGAPITVIESMQSLFVDFTTPQENLPQLAVGMPVRITTDVETDAGAGAVHMGTIEAIEPRVDDSTRAAKVRADIPNGDESLRPGMFVRVTVVLPQAERVVVVPATAVAHASFGDSVFVLEPKPAAANGIRTGPKGEPIKIAHEKFVRLGRTRGDFVSVLEGIAPGQEVASAGVFKLKNGAPVIVNNAIAPEPELSPHPMNR